MKSSGTIILLSLLIGLTTIAFPSMAQEGAATVSILDAKLPKLGFAIAESIPGEGLLEATIFESEEKVYLREVIDLKPEDVALAFVVSYGEIRIEFTEAGAKKVADLTGANIGKRLAVIFDGRVISVPTIRDKISSPALISGNFTIGEARKIASGIVSPPFHVYLVLIKSDWSNVKDAQELTTEMRRALKDVAVPQALLDGLPVTGPSILFPTEMVSLYTPQHYSDLLAWLKAHDLVIQVERFPTAEVTPISTARDATKPRMPTYTASITKPPAFLRLPGTLVNGNGNHDDREPPTAQPFVVKRLELGWHVSETPMSTTSSEKRLSMTRRVAVVEEKRGQEPSVSQVLDESAFQCHIRGNHVAVTQAFLNKHETEFRKAAQGLGFLPLIVTVPTRPATPKAIGKPIVRPPDIVETVETHYRTQYPFWPKPSDDRPIAPVTTKQAPVKNSASNAKPEEIMTVEIRLTFVDASSVAATLNQLYRDKLTIVADQRINSLLARGSAAVIDEVSELVKKLDSAQRSAKAPEIIPLEDARSKSSNRHATEIDRLRNEYKASEKAARETAEQIRSSAMDSGDPRLAELRRQLRAQVALSFRIRQDLQQAELDDMKRKLRGADEMIRQRNIIKEQIIDRRVIDLMNPRLKWDEPAANTQSIDGTDLQRPNRNTRAGMFPVGVQLLLPEGLALRTRPNETRPLMTVNGVGKKYDVKRIADDKTICSIHVIGRGAPKELAARLQRKPAKLKLEEDDLRLRRTIQFLHESDGQLVRLLLEDDSRLETEESAKRLATVRCFDTQNGNAEVAEATGNDFTTQLLGTWLGTANNCSMKLTFKQGGTFEIESQGHTSVEDGSRPVFASGSGTWAILGGEVVATYNYRGQEEFQTRLPLKIEAPTRLSYEGVNYYKQGIAADAKASQQPRY